MANNRKRLSGEVVSTKMEKTAMVRVNRSYRHPLYGKVVRSHKIYPVHDEIGCEVGDLVLIVESKPISKTKRWAVQEITRKVSEAERAAEQEVLFDEPVIEPVIEPMKEIATETVTESAAEAEAETAAETAAESVSEAGTESNTGTEE
jgi:small subunit ribosomal protein S17